jgi:hypothetical protein
MAEGERGLPVISLMYSYYEACLHKFPVSLGATSKTRRHKYIRNGNNIHINLFANAEAAIYTMESELHCTNLKMLHNNMQRYQTIRIIHRQLLARDGEPISHVSKVAHKMNLLSV